MLHAFERRRFTQVLGIKLRDGGAFPSRTQRCGLRLAASRPVEFEKASHEVGSDCSLA